MSENSDKKDLINKSQNNPITYSVKNEASYSSNSDSWSDYTLVAAKKLVSLRQ